MGPNDNLKSSEFSRVESDGRKTKIPVLDYIRELEGKVAKYQSRLEIDHAWRRPKGGTVLDKLERYEIAPQDRDTFPDAIDCRDSTIKHLDKMLDETAPIIGAAGRLMDFVMDKYKVESNENLTCPHHRKLYEALEAIGYFDKED